MYDHMSVPAIGRRSYDTISAKLAVSDLSFIDSSSYSFKFLYHLHMKRFDAIKISSYFIITRLSFLLYC